MKLFPPAKINLGLNIVSKRPDGYHDLETVFFPLYNVTDILEVDVVPGEVNTVTLTLDGGVIEGDPEKNLVTKAYRLLSNDFTLPAMSIKLTKRIPMQAGMGGGSSDAAYTLKAVNELAGLGLDEDRLEAYALRLGADAPFFVRCQPCYAEGVGEKMTPIALDLSAYDIRYLKPEGISVSTADAFRNIPVRKPLRRPDEIVLNEPIWKWKELLENDFEKTVFAQYPQLKEIKQNFYAQGAIYAAMTGSGSAIIGIFSSQPPSA